jgi:hypothetical protein
LTLAPALAAAQQQSVSEEHAAIGVGAADPKVKFERTRHPDAQFDLLWFDGKPAPMPLAEIRKPQPGILVNDRAYGTGDFNTHAAERELPETRPAKDWWENCQVWAKSSWAYVDEDYKPNSRILEQFVRVRAWNGNFLLNVGPMATGDLPPVAYERMKEFGAWVARNGESVFGAKDAAGGRERECAGDGSAGCEVFACGGGVSGGPVGMAGRRNSEGGAIAGDGRGVAACA